MKRNLIPVMMSAWALAALLVAGGQTAAAQTGGGYDLTWNSVDGGGTTFSTGGGYSLGRGAAEITVADIIVAVDEPIDATGCGGKESCMGDDAGKCMTHDLWASLNTKMIEYLDSISLKKLVDDQLAKGVSIDEAPVKRAISSQPVVKPIKVTAPNSVFALGSAFNK
jgi:Rrf2 family iron-sulfur cluster assembly transcriptional regulator